MHPNHLFYLIFPSSDMLHLLHSAPINERVSFRARMHCTGHSPSSTSLSQREDHKPNDIRQPFSAAVCLSSRVISRSSPLSAPWPVLVAPSF